MADVEVKTDRGRAEDVSPSAFLEAWSTARPISATDSTVTGWQYSPWFSGKFKARSEQWSFRVFLGGLGRLESSSGASSMFLLDAELIEDAAPPGSPPPPASLAP
jgi:hypothetical protein